MAKTVVLGISGGIAVYKSADLVSRLRKQGLEVYVIMTKNATEFMSPLTFETLSGHPVVVDTFHREAPWEVEHIALAKRADVFVIAPATANIIAKMAAGIADDMLSTTVLATKAPILVAPAMNENMWANPITQRNCETLRSLGVSFVGPAAGILACGDIGYGRVEEPPVIVEAILDILCEKKDFAGKRVLVTAGPTSEPIDPVRFITNRSSGKMGFAIAQQAKRRGAEVTVVHGAVSVQLPHGVKCVPIETTQDMLDALSERFADCDVLIKAAAPADYRALHKSEHKIKKSGGGLTVEMTENPDIVATLTEHKEHQIVVGFAAETQDVLAHAEDKMRRKRLDMIVANDVSAEGAGFSGDTNIVTVLKPGGYRQAYPMAAKSDVANLILDEIAKLF